jgi:hypothetical protein
VTAINGPSTKNQRYFFVSYAHADADADVIREEIGWMRESGLDIWFDQAWFEHEPAVFSRAIQAIDPRKIPPPDILPARRVGPGQTLPTPHRPVNRQATDHLASGKQLQRRRTAPRVVCATQLRRPALIDVIENSGKDSKARKKGNKYGICGEHGGDPVSIQFCPEIGLDYVSCSPFRVPVARITAAIARALDQGWRSHWRYYLEYSPNLGLRAM